MQKNVETFTLNKEDIQSFEILECNKKVYDISVEDNNNFFLKTNYKEILVHNSGKTYVIQDLLIRLLEQIGQGILYTRYTMVSVDQTIMPLFVAHIESIADINNYDVTKKLIRNKRTGSFILFSVIKASSGDQTGRLKSLPNITTWVIEEGEDFNDENAFRDIYDSIRVK